MISDQEPVCVIQDNATLVSAVVQLEAAPYVAFDTEFIREKTYYPLLCLLQLATDNQQMIIDPFADIDFQLLKPVFCSPDVTKIVHSGAQDLEILYRLLDAPVNPVFDTQIAAQLIGLPQQIGLAAMVKHYTGTSLSKADSFSDWARRPLTKTQLKYAVDDVLYLPKIYCLMNKELKRTGRSHWLDSEMAELSSRERFEQCPERLWRKLKGTANLNRRQLAVLRELAVWRDDSAAARDLPRKWLVSDEQLVDIARRMPIDAEALYQTRGLRDRLNPSWRDGILGAVRAGKALGEDELPEREKRGASSMFDHGCILNLMQALVHLRGRENHVATNLLAPHAELLRLAEGQRSNLSILQGWRGELIGQDLLGLLDGRLYLSLDRQMLKVTSVLPTTVGVFPDTHTPSRSQTGHAPNNGVGVLDVQAAGSSEQAVSTA
ncbi:MAG: ribonuclease D [Actinomycetia bacterium]|nr:ribonuclease D [Actinomycetes bacterium]